MENNLENANEELMKYLQELKIQTLSEENNKLCLLNKIKLVVALEVIIQTEQLDINTLFEVK